MAVCYFSRREIDMPLAAPWARLEVLAERSDVLSMHLPGGADTRRLIDADLLARMKRTATVVKTAR